MKFNQKRYDYLQLRREIDMMTKEEEKELVEMASDKLWDIIEGDPDLVAVFKRLKAR